MFNISYCIVFPNHFSHNNQLIACRFLHISEQGRRNDLNKLSSNLLPSNEQQIFPSPLDVSSDSVHCNALTQSTTVSYAFSCHTTDTWDENEVESSSAVAPLHSKLPYPSWVHVFSKSSSTTSLRTQCAAVAYQNAIPPKVLHRRSRR
jgi:hypothetical protein